MRISCKICRRMGMSICGREKCAYRRKPYPPGMHGRKRSRSFGGSEYGTQLREKQKMKLMYGLRETQFQNYVVEAQRSRQSSPERLIQILESRLDNVVYRMGFASSRSQARQLVSHGHFTVNGRRVNIPSFRVKKEDAVAFRPGSVGKGVFKDLDIFLKKHETPSWISVDKEKKEGKITGSPAQNEVGLALNINTIVDFYSR